MCWEGCLLLLRLVKLVAARNISGAVATSNRQDCPRHPPSFSSKYRKPLTRWFLISLSLLISGFPLARNTPWPSGLPRKQVFQQERHLAARLASKWLRRSSSKSWQMLLGFARHGFFHFAEKYLMYSRQRSRIHVWELRHAKTLM